MGHSDVNLHWKPEAISDIMRDNGIRTRSHLVARLEPRSISRTAVYRSFDDGWGGIAQPSVLTAVAREFHMSLTQLVTEPSGESA